MKVLVIHKKGETGWFDTFWPFFEKTGIPAETLELTFSEESGGKFQKQFTLLFAPSSDSPTHVVILSNLGAGWYDFLAGFACGSHVPLLVYGEETIAGIPKEIAFCFSLYREEEALRKYLRIEKDAYTEGEESRGVAKARGALLDMGIPVTEKSLVQCIEDGGIREISLFLAAGFSPDTRDRAGVPIINIAARKGNREVTRFLILAGARLDQQAEDRGTSALIDSVMRKHYDVMTELIKAGSDVNIKSKDGQTALVVAVGADEEKMVEALLKAGADPDIPDSLGTSARKYAALFHKEPMMALFQTLAPPKV